MYRTKTEELARELAKQHDRMYGWSVFPPGGYYVGTEAELRQIGVIDPKNPNRSEVE